MSRYPEVKWAEREDTVFLTVLLPDAKNPKVNLDPEGVFSFSATAGAENHHYELKLQLHDKVNVEESKINIGIRNIFCVLEKAEKKWWNKLLGGSEKTPHYVKVDWDKWVDMDDDAGPAADLDMGGMDFSKFGDMGGMGGMGGLGDMGGMGGLGDMGGLGGMGGMGGLGGMGGMGGMGDFGGMGDDDSDDEGEEVSMPSSTDEKTQGEEVAEPAEKKPSDSPSDSKAGVVPSS